MRTRRVESLPIQTPLPRAIRTRVQTQTHTHTRVCTYIRVYRAIADDIARHDRMLSRSRIAKIDGEETRDPRLVKSLAIPRPYRSIGLDLSFSVPPVSNSSPSLPLLVQLGLISTRKREIAIGAGEQYETMAVTAAAAASFALSTRLSTKSSSLDCKRERVCRHSSCLSLERASEPV